MTSFRNVYRGDSIVLNSTVKQINGTVLNLTGATIVATLKLHVEDADGVPIDTPDVDALAQVTLAGGGIILDGAATEGKIVTTFPSSATEGLLGGDEVDYDISVTKGSVRRTVESGKITLKRDITLSA